QQRPGQQAVRSSVAGRDRRGAAAQGFGSGVFVAGALADQRQRANHALPGVEAVGRLALAANLLGRVQFRLDRRDHPLGDLVLGRENVGQVTVVTLGPDVIADLGLDQLRGDADTVAGSPHAALKHITNPELAPDLLHIDCPAFVGEGRIPGDDEEPADAGECSDDLLDYAVGEIFLLWIAAHVDKGQYRDRRLVGEGRAGRRYCRRSAGDHAVGSDRPRDVLELLLADVLKGKVELARGILLHPRRDANPARRGQAFEPGRDINPVTKDVAVLDDDVTDVDADAQLDAVVRGHAGVAVCHLALHFDGTTQ